MTLLSLQPLSVRFDALQGGSQSVPAPVSVFGTSWAFPNLGGGEGLIDISAAASQHDLAVLEQAFVRALCRQAGHRD